jgi:hypothetical protein
VADPLQCTRSGHNVEAAFARQAQHVSIFKGQIANTLVLFPGIGQKSFIAIDAERLPLQSNFARNSGGDGACSAAHIEDRHPGAKQIGQASMIALERPAIEYPRIGPVRLLTHRIMPQKTN